MFDTNTFSIYLQFFASVTLCLFFHLKFKNMPNIYFLSCKIGKNYSIPSLSQLVTFPSQCLDLFRLLLLFGTPIFYPYQFCFVPVFLYLFQPASTSVFTLVNDSSKGSEQQNRSEVPPTTSKYKPFKVFFLLEVFDSFHEFNPVSLLDLILIFLVQ